MNVHFSLYADLSQNFSDRLLNAKICLTVTRCCTFIDHHQIFPMKVVNKTCRRIYDKRGASDDQHIRFADRLNRILDRSSVQPFFIEDHIRFDDSSTFTTWDSFRFLHICRIIELPASLAVIPMDTSVKLPYMFTSGHLMQSVNVLGYDSRQLSSLLHFCKFFVGGVWLGLRAEHFGPVKTEKFFGIAFIERMA